MALVVPHSDEADDDEDPVHVVRDNATISSRVLPPKDSVEDTPATAPVHLRVAAVDVPDALGDIVGPGTRPGLGGVAAYDLAPFVVLEIPDGLGKQAGGDEVEETSGDDKEDLHGCRVTTPSHGREQTGRRFTDAKRIFMGRGLVGRGGPRTYK